MLCKLDFSITPTFKSGRHFALAQLRLDESCAKALNSLTGCPET